MSFSKKLIVIILIAAMAVGIIYIGQNNNLLEEENKKMSYYQTETLYLWYTDDCYTDFFTNAAVEFHDKNSDVRVIPTLVSSTEYLEHINEASVSNGEFPDLFVLTNDSLEKAYLSGLASKTSDSKHILNTDHFGEGALNAVKYNGESVAYPLTFETTVLLYNKTYLDEYVDKVNAGEVGDSEGGSLMDDEGNVIDVDSDPDFSASLVSLEDYIPKSFDDIISFSDYYEAGDGVDAILEWDVSNIFFNYLFVGNYMVVGGDAGDDVNNLDINNENTLECAQVFKNLNQVFSIDAETTNYEKVLKDFLDGKTVYTFITSDAIATVDAAVEEMEEALRIAEATAVEQAAEGEEAAEVEMPVVYEYGYALIPDVSASLKSRSLSVTDTLVINGYSEKKSAANRFAAFVSTEYSNQLYSRTGKLAASTDAGYTDEAMLTFQEEYSTSIPLAKIVEASNLWVQLEIAFRDIWDGEDVENRLSYFESQLSSLVIH